MKVLKPAASDIVLGNGLILADVSDTVGSVAFDFRSGAVNEFTIPIVDIDRKLLRRGLLREGTTLRYQGQPWQVAAVERDYRGDDVWLTVTARSRLARRLRNMTGPNEWKDTTATQVITSLVKKAGGVAVVEPGAKLKKVVQKRNQSALDLVSAIASDTSVEWVEIDGTLYVGTPWWAFKGRTNLPLWGVDVTGRTQLPGLEFVAFSSRSSLDDRQAAAEASLTVTSEQGVKIRPWHRMNIVGADEADNGPWLVTGSSWDDMSAGVQLTLQRPLKSSPKNGSTGNDSAGGSGGFMGTAGSLDGKWIEGADKRWPGCSRTPREFVNFAVAQARAGAGFRQSGCLAWVSIAVSGGEGKGGYSARYVWGYAPAGATKDPGNTNPPIGAIVVWGRGTGGGHGHIGISVGNGRFISATGGRVVELNIAGFGDYLGAMVPNFGGSYPTYPGAPGP